MPTNAPPRIAIPMPHSGDRDYAERAIPQYERAVTNSPAAKPVRIPLDRTTSAEVMKLEVLKIMERCDAVLLPGSNADVDPAKFRAPRSPTHGRRRFAPRRRRRPPAAGRLQPAQARPRHLLRPAEPQRLPRRIARPAHPGFLCRRELRDACQSRGRVERSR
jgi:hypothetical protein